MTKEIATEVSYSPSQNVFLLNSVKDLYADWPSDAIEVSSDIYSEYSGLVPAGKCRMAGDDGMPVWVEAPAPSNQELIETATYKKSELRNAADSIITPLQDAVDEGMSTDEEARKLSAWKKYRVLLNRVDPSAAPDITWPDQPSA